MDIEIRNQFRELWTRFFNNAELPIICYYSDDAGMVKRAVTPREKQSCFVCELAKVRNGESVYYDNENVHCGGGKRYLGFSEQMRPSFRYFLSCGIAGEMEGERYIKTPELVDEIQKTQVKLPVTGKYLIMKRWDKLEELDDPQVVIFFATPDVLSGLFTLTNYDRIRSDSIYTPFGAGCGSIIYYPYLEMFSDKPRAVIGMFDVSARPCVPANVLTFALPMKRFITIMGNMEESFLITDSWEQVKKRIK